MNDSEFLQLSDKIFVHITEQLDDNSADFDYELQGNVLTIDCENGKQIILNRHNSNHELWIAAPTGGFHFSLQNNGLWISQRNQEEFFATLNEILQANDPNFSPILPYHES